MCTHAAIYGKDGVAWAVSDKFPELREYSRIQTMDDGVDAEIKVNEFQCVYDAAGGSRMPSAAGIRIGDEKYVFVRHDGDY